VSNSDTPDCLDLFYSIASLITEIDDALVKINYKLKCWDLIFENVR